MARTLGIAGEPVGLPNLTYLSAVFVTQFSAHVLDSSSLY
jgi:hypothetical protein